MEAHQHIKDLVLNKHSCSQVLNTSHNHLSITMPSDTDTTVRLVLLNVVMYAFAYQLQRPVEPFLIKSLSEGADAKTVAKTYGRLQSFFQAAQTIGSPIVGVLLDKIGARYCSVIVFLASASSYAILASSTTLSHPVWKSTSATGASRRRVDGVEIDATIQHERTVKF